MKRLFAAVKIIPDEELTGIILDLERKLRAEKIKWADLKNIHITLKFFGETDADRIPGIIRKLRESAEQFDAFDLTLKGTGVFGSSYKPRVVWIGIEKSNTLSDLGNSILNEMETIGFEKDRQNFVPHITIGRVKYVQDKKSFFSVIDTYKNTSISTHTISQVILFESKLFKTGPEYSVVERFNLR